MGRHAKEAFSSDVWDWAMQQIPRIAATFHGIEQEELKAELAVTLLQLRLEPNPGVRNWKVYLRKCLRNRALLLTRKSRNLRSIVVPLDDVPIESSGNDNDAADLESRLELETIRRSLDSFFFDLLQELEQWGGNVSALARQRGKHRNTIHRYLRKIRQGKCPIEIESDRNQLERITQSGTASLRQIRRARIALAGLDGISYEETVASLGTSSATVARWQVRFREKGMMGLKSNHLGKKRSQARARLVEWLRNPANQGHSSVRGLARRFGLGKSTVQRLLKIEMVHMPPKTTL